MGIVIKNFREILADMISWIRGQPNNTLTDFSIGGPLRSILESSATELDENYYRLYQVEQSAFIDTATETDLDNLVAQLGITRFTATKATGHLRFEGDENTVIPEGTIVMTSTGISVKTTAEAIIPIGQNYISNVPAEALFTGPLGNVLTKTLIILATPIAGIVKVYNPTNFSGGRNEEMDEQLRTRCKDRLNTLSLGVSKSYEQWCLEADDRNCANYNGVTCTANNTNWGNNCKDGTYIQCNQWTTTQLICRAKAEPLVRGPGTVDLHIVSVGNEGVTPSWILKLCQVYVDMKKPLCSDVKYLGHNEKQIFYQFNVSARIKLKPGYSLATVTDNINQALSNYIDWTVWEWGQDVQRADLLSIVNNAEGVEDVETASFIPASNVIIGAYELPKLGTVTINLPFTEEMK